ncbi:MAG: hypothetical protein ACRDC3_14100, partial [Paraclostridium dentum]|uniref:hypothetical protein n=1 Tax=Paraclostridium dentum TaxID=2662455 RepID=UPI003EE80CEF
NGDKNTNIYLGVIPITEGQALSEEAFGSLNSIYLVPEGTSLLNYEDWRIDNIIKFSQKAKLHGTNEVKLILWDSIDKNELLNSDLQIARLENAGISYEFVSFNKMSKKIKTHGLEDELITAAIHSGAIGESVLSEHIFSASTEYNENLKNVILFGSYTIDNPDVSYTNQVEILKKLETTYSPNEYNIIFKGHPREISVNDWIENNSKHISFFKSFPYEIWQILGKGEFHYKYNEEDYSLILPESPSKIYSIFSTTLYGEDARKIETILGYNSIDSSNNLTEDVHPITSSDITEYNRWKNLTGETLTPFKMTYDWVLE